MDFYVYLHRKATTGEVFYVGKGTGDRAWQRSPQRRGDYWQRIVKKHGLIVEVAEKGLQEWYAHELEQDLIALYGRRDLGDGPLINLTDGGEGGSGRVLSEDAAARHAAKVRAATQTAGWKARHAAAVRVRSDTETWKIRNLAGAQKRVASDEWRAKIKQTSITRAQSAEYRAKLSAALRKKASDPDWLQKTTEINRALRAKPVLCVETGRVFDAGADALMWLRSIGYSKATSSTLSRACKQKARTAYGYTWRYA